MKATDKNFTALNLRRISNDCKLDLPIKLQYWHLYQDYSIFKRLISSKKEKEEESKEKIHKKEKRSLTIEEKLKEEEREEIKLRSQSTPSFYPHSSEEK